MTWKKINCFYRRVHLIDKLQWKERNDEEMRNED